MLTFCLPEQFSLTSPKQGAVFLCFIEILRENETKIRSICFLTLRIPVKGHMDFIEHKSPEDTELGSYPVWFLVLGVSVSCFICLEAGSRNTQLGSNTNAIFPFPGERISCFSSPHLTGLGNQDLSPRWRIHSV